MTTSTSALAAAPAPEITVLANGLRVVTQTMPHLETTSLGVWVATGARHEQLREHGISHLLEHMAFKGTAKRSARAIAEEIEQVGGDLNAATSLETTAYYARILGGDDGLALEILADILQNSSFSEEDLVREKEVVLQEIAGINDSPEEIGYDMVQEAAFGTQPIGRPIIGTPESVNAISSADLRQFLAARYTAPDMVIAAAGAVEHATIVSHAQALFGGLSGSKAGGIEHAKYIGGVRSSDRTFEQSHLMLGFEGPAYKHPQFYTAQVFSGLFGGGMSSRLFQEVRENRGLCYSIYSSAWGLADVGMFGVHAATGPEMMGELITTIDAELAKAAHTAAPEREVARAKAQMKAGLLMSLESSSARAEQMARQLLVVGRLLEVKELVGKVDAVTPEGMRAFAEQLATAKNRTAVVIGASTRSAAFAAQAGHVAPPQKAAKAGAAKAAKPAKLATPAKT
jgi:predicted Zn-dependent peptidase